MQSGATQDSISHNVTGNCSSKFMDTSLPLGLSLPHKLRKAPWGKHSI